MIIIWSLISAVITIILCVSGVVNSVGAGLLSFVIGFFALLLIWAIPCLVASLFVDVHKKNEKDSKFFRFYMYSILDILSCVLNYRVKITGLDKVPDGKFLLISNHRSSFDPIIQLAVFRKYNLSFVSKKENLAIPIFGKIMHRCSIVSLDRENPRQSVKAISEAAELIKAGVAPMGIYPEGTRNHSEGLLPFKAGAFKIAQKAKCPIVISVMTGSEAVMRNAFWKRKKINYKIIGVISADFVTQHTTAELSEIAAGMILDNMDNSHRV